MSLKRLKVACLILPVAVMVALDVVRHKLWFDLLHTWTGIIVTALVFTVLSVAFTIMLFKQIEDLDTANVTVTPIRNAQGELVAILGISKDITMERAERQAQQLAIMEEQERIGMDLHDGIIQAIYGVALQLHCATCSTSFRPTPSSPEILPSPLTLRLWIRSK